MQTRQKSLNLGDLGVIAPKRVRDISHPSPPETVIEGDEPPSKKSKRSHLSALSPHGLMSPPLTTVIRMKDDKLKPAAELSPPPSPGANGSSTRANGSSKIDVEGINDDIVVATIQQLERTGNRPHLVKELAAILATKLHPVGKSANPSALISSRLTAYLHRTWPAISPCPLAKDLSPVHPRRLYFYLTTSPHQPIPEVADPVPKANRIVSPSLSSASAADDEDRYLRQRQALSPSPEVDLSSPELDENHGDNPPNPTGVFPTCHSIARDRSGFPHPRRASPPLENEERDFKQTASALYEQAKARRHSQPGAHDVNMDRDAPEEVARSVAMSIEGAETEEIAARRNSEAAEALFGASGHHLTVPPRPHLEFSSPVIPPHPGPCYSGVDTLDPAPDTGAPPLPTDVKDSLPTIPPWTSFGWDSFVIPETIELDELDNMFDAY